MRFFDCGNSRFLITQHRCGSSGNRLLDLWCRYSPALLGGVICTRNQRLRNIVPVPPLAFRRSLDIKRIAVLFEKLTSQRVLWTLCLAVLARPPRFATQLRLDAIPHVAADDGVVLSRVGIFLVLDFADINRI